jgi:hypothetical protein
MSADDRGTGRRPSRVRAGLVRMYPAEWRKRYGDELLDLLETRRLTPPTIVSTLRGAWDAHARLTEVTGVRRDRARIVTISASTIAAAWAVFALAAAGVAKSTEDTPFTAASRSHDLISVTRGSMSAVFALSTAIVVMGVIPVAGAAIVQFVRRRDWRGLGLAGVPVLAAAAVVVVGWLAGQAPARPVHGAANVIVASTLAALVLFAVSTSLAAGSAALRRVRLGAWSLRLLTYAGAAAAATMSLGLLVGGAYGLAVWIDEPDLFTSSSGLLATPLPLTWVGLLVVAVAAVAVADRATLQLLHVRRRLS